MEFDEKIVEVEIKIKNTSYATMVAFLVDRVSFLKEIIRLRKKWQVRSPIYSKKKRKQHINSLSIGYECNKATELKHDLYEICRLEKATPLLVNVIESVLFTHKVKGRDFVPTKLVVMPYEMTYLFTKLFIDDTNTKGDIDHVQIEAILISPVTTIEDLSKCLAQYKEKMTNSAIDSLVPDEHKHGDYGNIVLFNDVRTNIHELREAYWFVYKHSHSNSDKRPFVYTELYKICPKHGSASARQKPNRSNFCDICNTPKHLQISINRYHKTLRNPPPKKVQFRSK